MKNKTYPLIIVSFLCLFLACQKKFSESLEPPANNIAAIENEKLSGVVTKQTTKTFLNGYIVDENNAPVAQALVNCGGNTVTTDDKGFFLFTQAIEVNKDYVLISVKKTGYMDGFRTFTPNRSHLAYHSEKIMLQSEKFSQTINANIGGTVTIDSIKLNFPANAVIKPNGGTYSGKYKIKVRYINPNSTDFPLQVSGMLTGLNSAGKLKALQSLGMVTVELQDEQGNKLEIAPAKTVSIEMPAVAGSPSSIPLWHFNETYGLWIEAGIATKNGNMLVAEVNHFSIWNIAMATNKFEIDMRFQDINSVPIASLRVDVYAANNYFVGSFFSDNNGEAILINCPENYQLTLSMPGRCDTISHILAPVTQSRNEIVTLAGTSIQSFSFAGNMFDCNRQAIPNQPFQLFISGDNVVIPLNVITDVQGHFSVSGMIPVCQRNLNLTVQAYAYMNNRYFSSSVTGVNAGNNVYNPILCDSAVINQPFNDSDIVNIPDPSLQQKVRQVIGKPSGTIYYIDVKNVNSLDLITSPVKSLIGLQFFTGLDSLGLFGSNVPDIAPLQNLLTLSFLNLSRCQISNILLLQNLTNLKELRLWDNNISDITPLKNLTNLKTVQLAGNKISDITPLENLLSVETLNLGGNNISDITPLKNLIHLVELSLDQNQLSNITLLQNFTSLELLSLSGTRISDITPLQNLARLKRLYLRDNPLPDITALQNLTNLESIFLQNCQLSDITPLQNLAALTSLYLSENQITDITPLQNLRVLGTLYLDSNHISDISPLQNLPMLRVLDLSNNQISNVPSFQNLDSLTFLYLSGNQISNIQNLQNLPPSISYLSLKSNSITDISALQKVFSLTGLNLNNTGVANLQPLQNLPNLQNLWLENNQLSTIQPLISGIPALRKLFVIQGNSIPANEITSFQNTHPSCQVQ